VHEIQIRLPRPGEAATSGAWVLLLLAVEGLVVLGERDQAANLYPLVLEAMEAGNVGTGFLGLVQKFAAIAAAAGEQWETATQHYETALRQAHQIPYRIEQPEVRRWYAHLLIERDARGDREKAQKLLDEAIEAYREIGMPKHVEMAEEMLRKL
jgi:tetratricopeptide (TPR) repeat protein